MFKAKIFKVCLHPIETRARLSALLPQHAGDFQTAASFMDEAQSLDTADRFVNCKCTKYLLRANQDQHRTRNRRKIHPGMIELLDHGEETCFVSRKTPRREITYVKCKCMWFELETARAYRRLKKYGEALKKCHR